MIDYMISDPLCAAGDQRGGGGGSGGADRPSCADAGKVTAGRARAILPTGPYWESGETWDRAGNVASAVWTVMWHIAAPGMRGMTIPR